MERIRILSANNIALLVTDATDIGFWCKLCEMHLNANFIVGLYAGMNFWRQFNKIIRVVF